MKGLDRASACWLCVPTLPVTKQTAAKQRYANEVIRASRIPLTKLSVRGKVRLVLTLMELRIQNWFFRIK